RPPLAARSLHGMRDADRSVNAAVDAKRSEDLRAGLHASAENCRTEAVKRQRCVSAQVAIEAPRDPPDAAAQYAAGSQKRQPQQQQDVSHLVAKLPGAYLAASLND